MTMTDDEIRDVFAELGRVGVDLGQPPGLALGTGFRDGEFLSWLRSLPDDLGHDAFVERLTSHVKAAQPNASASLPRGAAGQPHRFWPTPEQIHGAIDVLMREWDPLGARLGALSGENVTHHAFNAVRSVLGGQDALTTERRIAGMLGDVEEEAYGVRRSPRAQRRYLARRIIQVVVDQPGPPHEQDPWEEMSRAAKASMDIARAEGRLRETRTATSSGVTVSFGPDPDDPPALDPGATCTECGATGTVAVVGREIEPRYSRYCLQCWSAVRDRYMGRPEEIFASKPTKPEEETTPEGIVAAFDRIADEILFSARERVRFAASALWEDGLPLLEAVLASNDDAVSPGQRGDLRQLAREIIELATTMYGPMPPQVEAFVQRHGASKVTPASTEDPNGRPAIDPDA